MNSSHFDANKPIHLARRDVHFERAVEILSMPVKNLETSARILHIERIVHALVTAERHASFVSKTPSATARSRDFQNFLKLILDSAQSIGAMMRHQTHFEEAESFLCQFLNTTPEQSTLPALHYRRRADDLQEGTFHLLRLALSPFRELQSEDRQHMNDEERGRYDIAYDMSKQEMEERDEQDSGCTMQDAGTMQPAT
ncbi:MAG: hypothetical protein AAF492_05985 [Verrucomicrobiota bacterium]